MTNVEMNKVVGRAMGLMIYNIPPDREMSDPYIFDQGAFLELVVPYATGKTRGVTFWNPAENIAQAIEALNVWCDKTGMFWILRRGETPLQIGNAKRFFAEVGMTYCYADTPALAICKALVKAVSDE